jgi:O-methyltransferase
LAGEQICLKRVAARLLRRIAAGPFVRSFEWTIYDEEIRKNGMDWPRSAHTMVGVARLNNLHDLVQRSLDDRIPGNYVEAGIWRGGCCIMIKAVLKANEDKTRKVFVADSFAGFPLPRTNEFEADAGDIHHTFPQLRVSLDEVKKNFIKWIT